MLIEGWVKYKIIILIKGILKRVVVLFVKYWIE